MNTTSDDSHDLIVIGASSGGVTALKTLVSQLPEDLPAAVMIVLHTAPTPTLALLAGLLDDAGPLPAAYPEDGEAIRSSRIYVAPQDHHLIVRGSHLHLTRTPKENWTRPAINPLFRSAAGSFRRRVAALVLTGMLEDGTAGLLAVEAAGGTTVVQDPGDAEFPDMPLSALDYLDPDHIVLLSELPTLLVQLAGTPVAGAASVPTRCSRRRG
ncbi:MAG: chemotaxis protein CheB [Thiogranum sp.]|nr:chemotaxis protein CheB [Thiogranum sp.]